MRTVLTEEERKLNDIIEPYFDYAKCDLVADAPPEAKYALKRLRENSKKNLLDEFPYLEDTDNV